jgi:hypothetical protein
VPRSGRPVRCGKVAEKLGGRNEDEIVVNVSDAKRVAIDESVDAKIRTCRAKLRGDVADLTLAEFLSDRLSESHPTLDRRRSISIAATLR